MRRGAQPSGATILQMPASRKLFCFSSRSTYSTNDMLLTSWMVGRNTGHSGAPLAATAMAPGACLSWSAGGGGGATAGVASAAESGPRRRCGAAAPRQLLRVALPVALPVWAAAGRGARLGGC